MAAKKKTASQNADLKKALEDATKKLNGGKYMAKKNINGKLIAIVAGIGVLLIALILGLLFYAGLVGGRKLPGDITMAGVKISGMNRQDAIAAVEKAVASTYTQKNVEVTVGDNTVVLTPATTKAELDINKAVNKAFWAGQQKGAVDLTPYLSVDERSIRKALAPLAEPYQDSMFSESSFEIIGEKPALDEEHVNDPVQQVKIYKGSPSYRFSDDKLFAAVMAAYSNNTMVAEYKVPTKDPAPIDLVAIHNSHYSAPVNAEMDKTTFEVSAHQYGYGLDMENTEKLLAETPYGETVTIDFIRIAPSTTQEALSSVLFRDVLGSYTSYSSSQWGRDDNLRLACAAMNGTILMPGDVFDYNKALGERTAAKGYKPAAAYMGSETIETIGGGICQPSSTLYYCCLMADLEIVTRVNHGFISSYMPFGMDATVSWGGPDYRFRNNTEYPIRIEAYSSGGAVTVKLHGTDTKDYYVKMEYAVLGVDNWKVVEKEYPEDNEKGYKDGQVLVTPYTGYRVQTYKLKYDKQTDELISKTPEAYSVYSRRDREVVKIIPTETEPDPGTGTEPDPGTGTEPDPGTGTEPDPGTGTEPDPGTGTEPDPGTGNEPDPGSGNEPDPGTGNEPDPGTGNEPDQGAGITPDE